MTKEALQRAYRYCGWITTHHYENFPVASWLLPAPMRPHVAAVYAFARAADDFADETRYHGRSLELLRQWRSALQDGSDHPIFIALSDTVRRYDLPIQLLDDLLTAFTMDVTKRRYADWPDLTNYCKHSANPVGRLVLLLSGLRDEELHTWSDDICTALQLANHWQDLRIDLARDILYIPQDLLRSYGVTETELNGYLPGTGDAGDVPPAAARSSADPSSWVCFERGRGLSEHGNGRHDPAAGPVPSKQFQALMKELVARARALFDSGEPLVRHLKGGLRLEIRLTLLGGRAILDRIEAADYDVFRRRPVLSTPDKLGLLTRALLS